VEHPGTKFGKNLENNVCVGRIFSNVRLQKKIILHIKNAGKLKAPTKNSNGGKQWVNAGKIDENRQTPPFPQDVSMFAG